MTTLENHSTDGALKYVLTIPNIDLVRAGITQEDRSIIGFFDQPGATVADKLLGLELLVRRIEDWRKALRDAS